MSADEMRQCAASLLLLAAILTGTRPAAAQLVIGVYPESDRFPTADEEEEQKKEPEKILYSGDPVLVPPDCDLDDLGRLGLVCTAERPCKVFLELLDVRPAEDKIFLIGNLATASTPLSGVVLLSEDGGKSWAEATGRITGGALERMAFIDKQYGWIAGQSAGETVPLVPFLLATDNGGRDWTRYRIWAGSEERSASVLDLYFDSPEHGYILVERRGRTDPFELYETVTGGQSWSIRQIVAERPKIRRSRRIEPEPSWRIAQDEEAGVYEVEQRVEGAWAIAARFGVELGPCRLRAGSSGD